MWGFAHFAKNVAAQASRARLNSVKQTSYTPIQKLWANMYFVVDQGKPHLFKVGPSICQVYQL